MENIMIEFTAPNGMCIFIQDGGLYGAFMDKYGNPKEIFDAIELEEKAVYLLTKKTTAFLLVDDTFLQIPTTNRPILHAEMTDDGEGVIIQAQQNGGTKRRGIASYNIFDIMSKKFRYPNWSETPLIESVLKEHKITNESHLRILKMMYGIKYI